jgi:menaquinone-dependent protoporphyrinogen IX oxidase
MLKNLCERNPVITRRFIRLLGILTVFLFAHAVAYGQTRSENLPPVNAGLTGVHTVQILIAYQSKYGSTREYAQWIQHDLGGDIVNIEKENIPDLAGYDIIVIGGYVRAGKIVVSSFLQENWKVIKGKALVLFTTSGTPPHHPKIRTFYEKSLPDEIRQEILYFPLPGRMATTKLTWFDTLLVAIGKALEEDETLKRDMGKDFDGVRREHLVPLLEYLHDVKRLLAEEQGQHR